MREHFAIPIRDQSVYLKKKKKVSIYLDQNSYIVRYMSKIYIYKDISRFVIKQ